MSSSEKNGSEPESLSSVLADTQKCDGPCKKLFNVSKLKVYDCGHVICGNCFTEMPLRGVAEADGRCLLGECRRKFENSRRQQPRRQASIHRYLSDAVSALRRTKYAHLVQPPKPSRGDERHSGSLEESNGCEECRARAECQCCCSDCSDQVTLVSNPKPLVTKKTARLANGVLKTTKKKVTQSETRGKKPDGTVYTVKSTTTVEMKTWQDPKSRKNLRTQSESSQSSDIESDRSMPVL